MTKEFILRLWRTNPACGQSGDLNSGLPGCKFSAITAMPYCTLKKHWKLKNKQKPRIKRNPQHSHWQFSAWSLKKTFRLVLCQDCVALLLQHRCDRAYWELFHSEENVGWPRWDWRQIRASIRQWWWKRNFYWSRGWHEQNWGIKSCW